MPCQIEIYQNRLNLAIPLPNPHMPPLLSVSAANLGGLVFSPLVRGKALPEGWRTDSELPVLPWILKSQ